MFRRGKMNSFHHSFVETSQILEVHKVRGLNKGEVVRMNAIYIVHQHPFIFSDTFPYIRGFASLWFQIVPTGIKFIVAIDPIRNSLFNACFSIMGDIEQMIVITYFSSKKTSSPPLSLWLQSSMSVCRGIMLLARPL